MTTTASPEAPAALPAGLETMLPGPELAVLLGRVRVEELSGHDAVIYLRARQRQLSYEEVMQLTAIVQVGLAVSAETTERWDEPGSFAAEEIKCALGWSSVKARNRLQYGLDVINRLPQVFAAQREGRIDGTKTWAFAEEALDLADEHVNVVVERLLPVAPEVTTGELIRRIRRLAADLDRDWLERRYKARVTGRHVRAWVTKDGSGGIGGYDLPVDKLAAAERRIQSLAKRAKRAGDARRMDQLRADIMLLLLGAETDGMSDEEIVAWLVSHPDDPADLPTQVEEQDAWVPDGTDDTEGNKPPPPAPDDDDEPPDGDSGPDESGGPETPDDDPPPDDGGGGAVVPESADQGDGDADTDAGDGGVVFDGRKPESPPERKPEPEPAEPEPRWWGPAELRVRLSTLALWNERCGELAGKGPVPPVLARGLALAARGAEWRWVIVDDEHARPIYEGITRCRPRPPPGQPMPQIMHNGIVEIAVTEGELARMAGEPAGWVNGFDRVIADIVRQAAFQRADRQRATGSGGGGSVPETGRDGTAWPRRAGPRMYRQVQIRDRVCSEPFCHLPAVRCEQDHIREHGWGGPTLPENLDQKCAQGHRLKDAWDVFAMGQDTDRIMVWISRLGHAYWTQAPAVFDPHPLPTLPPLLNRGLGDEHLTPGQVPDRLLAVDPYEDPFNEVQRFRAPRYVAARQRLNRKKQEEEEAKAAPPSPDDDPPPF